MLSYISRETGVYVKLTYFQVTRNWECLQSSHPISLLIRSFVHNRNPTNIVGSVMKMTAIAMIVLCCFPEA